MWLLKVIPIVWGQVGGAPLKILSPGPHSALCATAPPPRECATGCMISEIPRLVFIFLYLFLLLGLTEKVKTEFKFNEKLNS